MREGRVMSESETIVEFSVAVDATVTGAVLKAGDGVEVADDYSCVERGGDKGNLEDMLR